MIIAPPEVSITRIRPSRGALALDLAEMWRFRDLLYFLSWRDVKVKYKQAALGLAWAVLVPIANMVVFGLVFGRVAQLTPGGIDPFAFYLSALVPWQYFSNCLTQSSNSLVGQAGLLTKIYLPRVFLPLSACLASLVDFSIAFAIMIAMMAIVPSFPSPPATCLLVPLVMLPALVAALGAGLGLAALNVKYRDVRYILPFLVNMWMYASVLVPFAKVREHGHFWAFLYGLNPMAGVVEATRWCLLHPALVGAANAASVAAAGAAAQAKEAALVLDPGSAWIGLPFSSTYRLGPTLSASDMAAAAKAASVAAAKAAEAAGPFPWGLLATGVPVAILMFVLGLAYFKRVENQFADIV